MQSPRRRSPAGLAARLFLLLPLLIATGCGADVSEAAGTAQDAGGGADTSGRQDGGGLEDAGPVDLGGGQAPDAGRRDAGGADAGRQDAGAADAGVQDLGAPDSGVQDAGAGDSGALDGGGVVDTGAPDTGPEGPTCPVEPCVVIAQLPFVHQGDTSASPHDVLDAYACAPETGERGPEDVFVLRLDRPGTLVVMLDDGGDVGADIDIHLLTELDGDACLDRGHIGLSEHLEPGDYVLVADSWSSDAGNEYAGPYTLYAHFYADDGPCGMLGDALDRIGADAPLPMPATGPVVKEAHLVTDGELPAGQWPESIRDGIEAHYALTQEASGYAMERSEPWAPCCEPSNDFGQGSTARPPAESEAFYVCMRWAAAPPRGQRYLVIDGRTGRAVVAAAGYENGPGDLGAVGGACEEIHHHLGSVHRSVLTFGVARDQTLPYGPVECGE